MITCFCASKLSFVLDKFALLEIEELYIFMVTDQWKYWQSFHVLLLWFQRIEMAVGLFSVSKSDVCVDVRFNQPNFSKNPSIEAL